MGSGIRAQRTRIILVALLLSIALAPFPERPASASCAAPYLKEVQNSPLERGATVTIEGRSFSDGCRDSQTCSGLLGCHSCEYDDPPPVPLQDIGLQLIQGEQTWDLGVADPGKAKDNQQGQVQWVVEMPQDAKPGPATLVADDSAELLVEVR